nr:TRAP transporter substrate-binding protein [Propioniciclava soli]
MIFSLNQTTDHPSYAALNAWNDDLAAVTGERWGIDVYANATLGGQQEVVMLVGDGAVDMAVISGTALENLNPDYRTMNLPGVFDGIDHQVAVTNNLAIMGELYSSLEESHGITVVGMFTQGARNLYTTAPVETPEQLSGMRIRVQESDVAIDMINAMGGAATPMPYGEVYTALQSGILDGAENNEVSYVTQRHLEVARHYTLTAHQVGLDFIVVHSGLLAGMRPADAEAFRASWLRASANHTQLWKDETAAATEQMLAEGVTIHEIDRTPFVERLQPVAERYLTSDVARSLYERIRQEA